MFRIKFGCENCGSEWTDVFKKKTRVKDRDAGVETYSADTGRNQVKCDICGLLDTVCVEERLGCITES